MRTVLYIPAYSAHVALTKYRMLGDEIPYYWRDPAAAHDMCSRHYVSGKVFAVSLNDENVLVAREHAMGEPEPVPDAVWYGERIGETAAGLTFLALLFLGIRLVGWGTLI